MKECISISKAKYAGEYRIELWFNTGECGIVDLKELVFAYPVAEPLCDVAQFADFYLDSWPTLAWSCGFDIDPESLYERATGKNSGTLQSV